MNYLSRQMLGFLCNTSQAQNNQPLSYRRHTMIRAIVLLAALLANTVFLGASMLPSDQSTDNGVWWPMPGGGGDDDGS